MPTRQNLWWAEFTQNFPHQYHSSPRPTLLRGYANADIQNETVFDRDSDRYLVMSIGWQKNSSNSPLNL
ncbi:MAG: hypothetical protein AB4426_24565 [Xenococcaceae cyanobacterium]